MRTETIALALVVSSLILGLCLRRENFRYELHTVPDNVHGGMTFVMFDKKTGTSVFKTGLRMGFDGVKRTPDGKVYMPPASGCDPYK